MQSVAGRERDSAHVAVFGRVLPRALLHGGWTALVALAALGLGLDIGIGPLAHSLLGVALGMLLVFRTNAAYERYWEGRRRWSQIVAESRCLMRGWVTHARGSAPGFVELVTAYVCAVADRLQAGRGKPTTRPPLRPDDLAALGASTWIPAALAMRMAARVRTEVESSRLRAAVAGALEGHLAALTEHEAACERIADSPMPRLYTAQIRQLLFVYLATLPFALVSQLGWFVVPSTMVIAFGLVGIEDAGTQIEDPFGDDANDLPLGDYCAAVQDDARLHARLAIG